MDAQEFRSLQEAYLEVYNELDESRGEELRTKHNLKPGEASQELATKAYNKASRIPRQTPAQRLANRRPTEQKDTYTKLSRKADSRAEQQKESVDLFDYLLEYLVAEGYADTNKAALAIMANMSEEWKEDIVEGMDMKAFKERRRKLQRQAASDDAKKRGHVDKFTGKPYSTAEAESRRRDIHSPAKAPEREARRKFAEDPD